MTNFDIAPMCFVLLIDSEIIIDPWWIVMVFSRSENEPPRARRSRRKNKNLSELRVKKMTRHRFTMDFEKAMIRRTLEGASNIRDKAGPH
jgi:hypothetical protein